MSRLFDVSTPDPVLVRGVLRDRSDAAFSVLYDRHTPRAFQTAWRILGGRSEAAEDAVQETWIRAIASLQRWRGAGDFGAWLRGIAAHVAIDAVRADLRFGGDIDGEWAEPDAADDRFDLESAIAALAPGYRAVLVLHDIEGFTHEEIASRLGVTTGTSKAQLFKARRAVRARLTVATEGRS